MLLLQRIWLYIERVILIFQRNWLESEIKYIDKRIEKLERK